MRVDVDVEREIVGTIKNISPMAIARNRDDPRQYVAVTVSLDNSTREGVRIGSGLSATVVTAQIEDAIVVPQQAVFTIDEQFVVFVN